MDIKKELIRVTSEYFEDTIDYLKLSNASREYKSILHEISDQNIDIEEGRNDIKNKNGNSLGTFWAALCLDDQIRTRQFIRGIDKAIKETKKGKPIHILYAGTGPFATLILPLILRYPKKDITYTLLEINPFTYGILQNIISKLGVEEYHITLVKDDATAYQIDPKNKPDIIISETMQSALAKEQQVPIFLNLMSQVPDDTVFIPEKIELHLGLKKTESPDGRYQEEDYTNVNKVFEVSKESMFTSNPSEKKMTKKDVFTKKKTVIEEEALKGCSQLFINTDIQVYKDIKIDINDSGLTTPILIREIPNNIKSAITVDTQYVISSEPKLEYKVTLDNAMHIAILPGYD
jgi:predicted RNA methylase